jgi:diguanylate cyclase (GGDEF)-like protein
MPTILIVEDSKLFANLLKKRIETELEFNVETATSYAEASALLEQGGSYDVALLDLTLEDSQRGEIVDLVAPRAPSIVFTGDISDATRDMIWARGIADYVLKENTQSVNYIINAVRRLIRNRDIKAMVVDDSSTQRKVVERLLSVHRYQVFAAENGVKALEELERNPDIKIIFTDFNMPEMDGFELTKVVRRKYDKETLAIIGLSAEGGNIMSARFIKNGANDFLTKPFISEEFYCRLNHNIEMLEHIEHIKDISNKDYLTQLYNRRYFFSEAAKIFSRAKLSKKPLAAAMLDIDKFKSVNDVYGHYAGDVVLKVMAGLLRERFKAPCLLARFGGEEFCALMPEIPDESLEVFFEDLRREVSELKVRAMDNIISFTTSIGVSRRPADSLDGLLNAADKLLYEAKNSGRNKVLID